MRMRFAKVLFHSAKRNLSEFRNSFDGRNYEYRICTKWIWDHVFVFAYSRTVLILGSRGRGNIRGGREVKSEVCIMNNEFFHWDDLGCQLFYSDALCRLCLLLIIPLRSAKCNTAKHQFTSHRKLQVHESHNPIADLQSTIHNPLPKSE